MIWLPNSQSVLAYARSSPALEADWWLVPLNGGAPRDTGLVARLLREKNLFTMGTGAVWAGDGLTFSAAGADGVHVYRQRLEPSTMVAVGAPERLTTGSESGWFPTAAAEKVAFVSSQADANLWSLAIDAATGIARDPLRRMTRGPGILGFVTATTDFQALAYFSVRFGEGDIFLRDLRTGSERHVSEGPAGPKWYPALVRSAIRARPIAASGPADQPFAAYSSADMLMPAYFAGTAPLATPDQIVLVLGDFRGDVWIRDLD